MAPVDTVLTCGSLRVGGTERNVILTANRLARDGDSVAVLIWNEAGPLAGELDPRVALHSLSMEESNVVRALSEAVRILRGWRPNRVHAFGFPIVYYGAIAAGLAGVPATIAALQDRDVWKGPFEHALDRLTRPLIDRYIADGAGTADFSARRFGYPQNRIRVIYDGPEPVPDRDARDRGHGGRIVFGLVARIDLEKKGQEDFLEAISILGADAGNAVFRIVGSGPPAEEEALRRRARDLGVEERIEWMPAQSDLDSVYRSLDVLVIPSRWESVPKVLVEGMARKIAVLATRVGDIAEILDPSCGVLVEPESPASLARELAIFVRDPDRAVRMGAAAARRLDALGLTLDNTIARLREVYAETPRSAGQRPLGRRLWAGAVAGWLLAWNFGLYVRNTPNRLHLRRSRAKR